MFVVDTNILVYAADEYSSWHAACRAKVEEWRKQTPPWYATWGIVYEFLRVITHPPARFPQAVDSLEDGVASTLCLKKWKV